ncbi:MAG: MscL family protein [Asgard group archaeon]|nr:MscL family protein [Asgard group archaeon]
MTVVEEEILKELTKIRELLEPKEELKEEKEKPKGIKHRALRFKDDFVSFLKSYGVIGLTVAFIMGLYLKDLVDALVGDLIMPIIAYIPGVETWDTFLVGEFAIGHFLGILLMFIMITLVVFSLVKISKRIGLD